VISDRIIEQGTLRTDGARVSVEVRMPWYRALPASCIGGATLTIDGTEVSEESLRWEMNGMSFTFAEMVNNVDQWWFPVDSAILSGDLPLQPGGERIVEVGVTLYIPYIIMSESEVLHIDEHDQKTMTAVAA
jgi:hypothetical protein